MKGKLITFEGIDGAGKTTQIELVKKHIQSRNFQVLDTREPGGTKFGEKLRNIIFENNEISSETETLLMFAARIEHLNQIIMPALKNNYIVLCDRFTDATFAYQGAGGGVSFEKIKLLENWVHHDLQPDITFYFDLSIKTAISRIKTKRDLDAYEKEKSLYFKQIKEGYLQRAKLDPNRFKTVDAEMPRNKVNNSIMIEINQLLVNF